MTCTLLCGAIGDSLGMPFESKPYDYEELLKWDGKSFLPSKYHNLKSGEWTDDSQASVLVAESLINNNGFNPDDLAARYVDWIESGLAKGCGKTTVLAIKRLSNKTHWSESGVLGSYGNGTAMRAAPFGIYFRDNFTTLIKAVKIDSAITHVSPDAEAGALAIALAAAYVANFDTEDMLERIVEFLPDSDVKKQLTSLQSLIDADHIKPLSALKFLGTKAKVQETVPAALYCFLKMDSFHEGIETSIRAGGDTDTTASIVGALFGSQLNLSEVDPIFHSVQDFNKLADLDKKLYNRTQTYTFFPRK